jgi:hypothetical protein
MTYSETEESRLFGNLRNYLREDLVSSFGFPAPVAGEILNWFDPAYSEYLEHVNDWQVLLCKGASCTKKKFAVKNAFGSYDISHLPAYQVGAIHQIAKLMYKFHGNPRKETDMSEVKMRLSKPLPITLDRFERKELRNVLAGVKAPDLNCVIGRFGPGATSEGFNSWMKWMRKGAIPNVPPNLYRVNCRDTWSPVIIDETGMTRIAEVPKSIKSNRIVSSEPAMRMFAQLAVADDLSDQLHKIFRGHVSLHDADRHNEFLLRPGACSIDLSDASDHVSCELVQAVLPQIWPVLAEVRSQEAYFPDGTAIRLATFAPMGSGTTFPILTLITLAICEVARRHIRDDGKAKEGALWYSCYGDDIIVPVCMYDEVIRLLKSSGLKVNDDKSCCTGIYRESCGREMYYGENITPAYIRDPLERCDASKIEDVCSKLYARGFCVTANAIAETAAPVRAYRYNHDLQMLEVCVRTSTAQPKLKSLDGFEGLMRWFAVRTQQEVRRGTNRAKDHQGVSVEVWTKQSWRFKPSDDYPYLTTWFVTKG